MSAARKYSILSFVGALEISLKFIEAPAWDHFAAGDDFKIHQYQHLDYIARSYIARDYWLSAPGYKARQSYIAPC